MAGDPTLTDILLNFFVLKICDVNQNEEGKKVYYIRLSCCISLFVYLCILVYVLWPESQKAKTRSSGLFLDYLDTFSRLSGHCLDRTKISRSSTLFLDYPDTFSILSGHFLDCPETFQFIRTLCILSGYFVLQSIQKICKVSRWPGKFPDDLKSVRII